MKLEDIYGLKEISQELLPFYENVIEGLNCLEYNLGSKEFVNEKVSEEQLKECNKAEDKLVDGIIGIVKTTEADFDFEPLKQLCGNDVFWKRVRRYVRNGTGPFLRMCDFRKLPFEERKKNYEYFFDLMYVQYENIEYAVEEKKIPEKTVSQLFEINRFCEDVIAFQDYSKRRFKKYADIRYGLQDEDTEVLWLLFDGNRKVTRKSAFVRHISKLERKLYQIETSVEYMQRDLDTLYDYMEELHEQKKE